MVTIDTIQSEEISTCTHMYSSARPLLVAALILGALVTVIFQITNAVCFSSPCMKPIYQSSNYSLVMHVQEFRSVACTFACSWVRSTSYNAINLSLVEELGKWRSDSLSSYASISTSDKKYSPVSSSSLLCPPPPPSLSVRDASVLSSSSSSLSLSSASSYFYSASFSVCSALDDITIVCASPHTDILALHLRHAVKLLVRWGVPRLIILQHF